MTLPSYQAISYEINKQLHEYFEETRIRDVLESVDDFNNFINVIWLSEIGDLNVAYEVSNRAPEVNKVKGHKSIIITITVDGILNTRATIEYNSMQNHVHPQVILGGSTDIFNLFKWHTLFKENMETILDGIKTPLASAVKIPFNIKSV